MQYLGQYYGDFSISFVALIDDIDPGLKIWIFNYGEINITVEWIRVRGSGNLSTEVVNIPIPAGEIVRVDVTPTNVPLASGVSVAIEVKSTRGNKAYAAILIP